MLHKSIFITRTIAVLLLIESQSLHQVQAFVVPSSSPSRPRHTLKSLTSLHAGASTKDNFVVGVLGDLHIDPRKMEDYETGRQHFSRIFRESKENGALVSLGDLGESKAVFPGSDELFSGTTACHEMAAEYLNDFGVPYEVVGGNHGK